MRRNLLLFLLFAGPLVPRPGAASTLVVPDAFATVGAALAAAAADDTVLVRSGTYLERVTMVDGVVLAGESAFDRPVLDGSFNGAVLSASGCGADTRVVNLVLRNGGGGTFGGGATLANSDLTFENCRFTDNLATNGGGLGATSSDFTLIDCTFDSNSASQAGGAIAMSGASVPSIEGCAMAGNSAVAGGGVAVLNGTTPDLVECLIDGNTANQGAAIWWDFFSGGAVHSCTIVENMCLSASTGALHSSPFSAPAVDATIVAFTIGAAATFTSGGASPIWGCNDAFGNSGGDVFAGGLDLGTNLFLDPAFCDAPGGNWTLSEVSPCLPGGGCPRRGAFDQGCTVVSATEAFRHLTWGRAKAIFRGED